MNASASRRRRFSLPILFLLMSSQGLTLADSAEPSPALPHLSVSQDGRHLMVADGRPFFWLGDTAWQLFHRLDREEASAYLAARARQGFNVIQAVCLAEEDGLGTPNAYGHMALIDRDPARPALSPDGDDYWTHVDFVVAAAAANGLYTALLPTWGSHVTSDYYDGVVNRVFTSDNAVTYGRFLGKRYPGPEIIWVLGGDRSASTDEARAVWRAMAKGIEQGRSETGAARRALMTYHEPGPGSQRPRPGRSSDWFHHDVWLDFHMIQTGHGRRDYPVYEPVQADYALSPVRPTFNAEPCYEDLPVAGDAEKNGRFDASDVRRAAYWSVFAGAFGHTYGHHSVWQMWRPGVRPRTNPNLSWWDALSAPGASQMRHLHDLVLSRPFFSREPDQSLLVPNVGHHPAVALAVRGEGFVMVYLPERREVRVRTARALSGPLRAWWYDVRAGVAQPIGTFAPADTLSITPPFHGGPDGVLVLDEIARGFPAPGSPAGAGSPFHLSSSRLQIP